MVDDLNQLCGVRSVIEDPDLLTRHGFSIVRVENKFVSNIDSLDPYRCA